MSFAHIGSKIQGFSEFFTVSHAEDVPKKAWKYDSTGAKVVGLFEALLNYRGWQIKDSIREVVEKTYDLIDRKRKAQKLSKDQYEKWEALKKRYNILQQEGSYKLHTSVEYTIALMPPALTHTNPKKQHVKTVKRYAVPLEPSVHNKELRQSTSKVYQGVEQIGETRSRKSELLPLQKLTANESSTTSTQVQSKETVLPPVGHERQPFFSPSQYIAGISMILARDLFSQSLQPPVEETSHISTQTSTARTVDELPRCEEAQGGLSESTVALQSEEDHLEELETPSQTELTPSQSKRVELSNENVQASQSISNTNASAKLSAKSEDDVSEPLVFDLEDEAPTLDTHGVELYRIEEIDKVDKATRRGVYVSSLKRTKRVPLSEYAAHLAVKYEDKDGE